MGPPEHVLDLFAVPGAVQPLPGGQGASVRAGDLVLSPGRDSAIGVALNPQLARLANDLDTRPGRDRRDLRIAMPVPARDGSWTVNGWGASRFEPGSRLITDLAATRAVAAVLHAEFATAITSWPLASAAPRHRWDRAERIAFGDAPAPSAEPESLLGQLLAARDLTADLGPSQLVHADLAGNVLLDADGAPVVIDVAPYWRPTAWAEAVCVLDSVMWWGADASAMTEWRHGSARQAMIRAALFRILSDDPPDAKRFAQALTPLSC